MLYWLLSSCLPLAFSKVFRGNVRLALGCVWSDSLPLKTFAYAGTTFLFILIYSCCFHRSICGPLSQGREWGLAIQWGASCDWLASKMWRQRYAWQCCFIELIDSCFCSFFSVSKFYSNVVIFRHMIFVCCRWWVLDILTTLWKLFSRHWVR